MHVLSRAAPSLALLVALFALVTAGTLKVAFTGYVHGGFTSSVDGNFCPVLDIPDDDASSPCVGGCDRREAYLHAKKANDPNNTVLADLGNYYWGSVYYTMYGPGPGVECFSRVGYDVSSVGGSDMYGGYALYGSFVESMSTAGTTFVGTNTDPGTNSSDPLNVFVKKSYTHTLSDGTVVGFVTPLSSTYATTAGIPAETGLRVNWKVPKDNMLRREIFRLRSEGAAAVVLMVEMTPDITPDLSIIKELENVAAVLISRSPNPGVRVETNIFGDEFLVVALPDDNGATVGWFEAEIAPKSATSPPNGLVSVSDAAASSSLVTITSSMPFAADLRTLFKDNYDLLTNTDFTRRLGEAIGTISGAPGTAMEQGRHGCRTASCPMGRLLTDAVESFCTGATPEDGGHGKCLVMINSGAIRSSFTPPTGTGDDDPYAVRTAHVYEVLPFFNTLVKIRLTGAVVLAALANSISQWPNQSGRFLQTNLRVVFNPFPRSDVPAGDASVRLLDAHALLPPPQGGAPVWAPINPEAVYEVVTTNYLVEGHDGYENVVQLIQSTPRLTDDTGSSLADALAAHVVQSPAPLQYPTVDDEGACLSAQPPLPDDSPCRTVYVNQTYDEYNTCETDLAFCNAHQNTFIFETMWISSNCGACSGAGTCIARRCICSGAHTISEPGPGGVMTDVTYVFVAGVPTAGRWAGTLMLRGDACNEVRELSRLSKGARISMYVAAGVAYVASLVWFVIIFLLQNKPVVRASSPKFSMIMCVGGMVGATSIIMDAFEERTVLSCNASVWLLVIGYSLMFACLFVKTHRIHHIFNAKMLKGRATYTDLWVLFYVFLITLINVAILLIFRLVAPLEPSFYPIPGHFAIGERCAGDEIAFTVMLIVFNGLLLGWGIYLAVRTRNVDSNFNESKYIGACIYNCALSGLVILLLVYVARDTEFTVVNIIMSWGIAYVIVSTLCIVLLPRVTLYVEGVTAGSNSSRSISQADLERQLVRDRRTIQALVERMKLHDAAVEERDQVLALLTQELKSHSIEPPEVHLTPSDDPATAGGGTVRGTGSGTGVLTERHRTNASNAEGAPTLNMQRPAFAGHGGDMLQVTRSALSSDGEDAAGKEGGKLAPVS